MSELTAPAVSESCVKSGYLEKQGYRFSCSCFGDVFKLRYAVLKGKYLFKFNGPEATSPLGRPIALLGARITEKSDLSFTLSTIPKDYMFRADSPAELQSWTQAIQNQMHLAIKQEKGHAEVLTTDVWSDKLAFAALDQYTRLQQLQTRDAEFRMM
eukprot:TRINITY_DN16634_c0_g2_i2.p1 TRINITY_DN16634_c0_g2~~TRINITY_DN16634_c0_g2_i2.p1  ORF type:complete len:156 (-),score=26.49 TRINITY_DN16634_c0_g2_i2:327-794(-)